MFSTATNLASKNPNKSSKKFPFSPLYAKNGSKKRKEKTNLVPASESKAKNKNFKLCSGY